MQVSLIVTTYNWPFALDAVLQSIRRQTVLPLEVIVADDGSGHDTRLLIENNAQNYPVPLKHSWQIDEGFRLARSRNLAIALAQGEYIIIIDGDMVLDSRFIEDHIGAAKAGCYVQGTRMITKAEFNLAEFMQKGKKLHFFSRHISKRSRTLRLPLLSKLILKISEGKKTNSVKGCNQAYWRKDLLALNGFDERFIGWGREDRDLMLRAIRMGLKRRELRFSGLAAHIYHNERRPIGDNPNDRWINENTERRITKCLHGLDQHQS